VRRIRRRWRPALLIAGLAACASSDPGGSPGSAGRNTPGDTSPANQATGNYEAQDENNRQEAAAEDSASQGAERGASTAPEPTITPANPEVWNKGPYIDGTGGGSNSGRLAGEATSHSGVNASSSGGSTPRHPVGVSPFSDTTGQGSGSATGAAGVAGGVSDEQRTIPAPGRTVEIPIDAQGAVGTREITMAAGTLLQLTFVNRGPNEVLVAFQFPSQADSLPILTLPTPATIAQPGTGADSTTASRSPDRVLVSAGASSTVYLQQDAAASYQVQLIDQTSGKELPNGLTIVVQ